MKVTEVTVSKSQKVNLGNYETTDVSAVLKVELEPGEDHLEVIRSLSQQLRHEIHRQVAIIRGRLPENGDEST
ncbi:MAG: hypothetical protein ACXACI_12820 [Candidatus Hodarchaeales archaeon]|jgi:hypothetical protein